ncbi:MAG: hypothetical protein IPJ74_22790 [Saprospiraceae bacterium]|nr:hypothetical protein [Saprospiraceae bacterium]
MIIAFYLEDIINAFENSTTNQILVGITASYILCVATHQLGYQWFKKVGIRLYKYSYEGYVSGHKSDHLGASVLLLKRAVLFHDWYLRDLEHAVTELHLIEKAKRFPHLGIPEEKDTETAGKKKEE